MVSKKDELAKLILSRSYDFDKRKDAWTEDILRYHNYVQLRTHFATGSLQICFDRKREWFIPSEWAKNHSLNITRAFDEAAERLLYLKGDVELMYILGTGSGFKKFRNLIDSNEFMDLVLKTDSRLARVLTLTSQGQELHEYVRGTDSEDSKV